MDPLTLVNGQMPTTLAAKFKYVFDHVAGTLETGVFKGLTGYLAKDGRVLPNLENPDLWERIGHRDWTRVPSPRLLRALLAGRDLEGRPLVTARGLGGKPLFEVLITLPSELSAVAASMDPRFGQKLLSTARKEVMKHIECQAVQVRTGKGQRKWAFARVLAMGFDHAENRAQEPHLHDHLVVMPLAWDPADQRWRTPNLRRAVQTMHHTLRPAVSEALGKVCEEWGVEVAFEPGLARERTGLPGWTVQSPSGLLIPAGSLQRVRTAESMAKDVVQLFMGGASPREADLAPMKQWMQQPHFGKPLPQDRKFNAALTRLLRWGHGGELNRGFRSEAFTSALEELDTRFAMAEAMLDEYAKGRVAQVKAFDRPRRCRALLGDLIPTDLHRMNTRIGQMLWKQARDEALDQMRTGIFGESRNPINRIARQILEVQEPISRSPTLLIHPSMQVEPIPLSQEPFLQIPLLKELTYELLQLQALLGFHSRWAPGGGFNPQPVAGRSRASGQETHADLGKHV